MYDLAMVYVEQAVVERLESPESGQSVTLVVGVANDADSVVQEQVSELGGEVVNELPFNSLQVTIPESALAGLRDATGVESLELDEGMEVLEGNV